MSLSGTIKSELKLEAPLYWQEDSEDNVYPKSSHICIATTARMTIECTLVYTLAKIIDQYDPAGFEGRQLWDVYSEFCSLLMVLKHSIITCEYHNLEALVLLGQKYLSGHKDELFEAALCNIREQRLE